MTRSWRGWARLKVIGWVACQSHSSGSATAQALLHANWQRSHFLLPDPVISLTDNNGPLMNFKSQASAFTLHHGSLTPDLPAEWSRGGGPVCRSHAVIPYEFDQTASRAANRRVEGGWRPAITAFNHQDCTPTLLTVTCSYEAPRYVVGYGLFIVLQWGCSQSGTRDRGPTAGTEKDGGWRLRVWPFHS